MADIDGFISKLRRQGATKAELITGEAGKVWVGGQEITGAVVTEDWLRSHLGEVLPVELCSRLGREGCFEHLLSSAEGTARLLVKRQHGVLSLTIDPSARFSSAAGNGVQGWRNRPLQNTNVASAPSAAPPAVRPSQAPHAAGPAQLDPSDAAGPAVAPAVLAPSVPVAAPAPVQVAPPVSAPRTSGPPALPVPPAPPPPLPVPPGPATPPLPVPRPHGGSPAPIPPALPGPQDGTPPGAQYGGGQGWQGGGYGNTNEYGGGYTAGYGRRRTFVNTSGQGSGADVPEEVKGWSWGGFLAPFFWGISHNVWICLLVFVPFPLVALGVSFYLGINGNELAWRNRRFDSVEHFHEVQGKWRTASLVLVAIGAVFGAALAMLGES